MSFPAIGTIIIDGVRLTYDPSLYKPLEWPKRFSVHPVLGGGVVIQDFGVRQGDLLLKFTGQNPLAGDVVAALHTRYRAPGGVYPVTDWLGNVFSVVIERFAPVPLRTGVDLDGAPLTLWSYELDLRVVTITTLLGQPYVEAA